MLKSPIIHNVEDYRTWIDRITGPDDEYMTRVSRMAREKAIDHTPLSFPCIAVLAVGPGSSGPYCEVDFVPIAAG
jgi:hypothetical protein